MKRVSCPELLGVSIGLRGEAFQWGIVEYIQDFLMPMALGTVEGCDAMLRVGAVLAGKRGPEQTGQPLDFEDGDLAILKALASRQRDGLSPENLIAVATYNRALFLAETLKAVTHEKSGSPKKLADRRLTPTPKNQHRQ